MAASKMVARGGRRKRRKRAEHRCYLCFRCCRCCLSLLEKKLDLMVVTVNLRRRSGCLACWRERAGSLVVTVDGCCNCHGWNLLLLVLWLSSEKKDGGGVVCVCVRWQWRRESDAVCMLCLERETLLEEREKEIWQRGSHCEGKKKSIGGGGGITGDQKE